MSSLATHTSQPREHEGRPGNSLWLLDELSQRKPRNTCVSVLQTQTTAVVSSHRKLALSVARQLGLQKEAVQIQTVGLGVDVSAGKTRTVTSARRKKRIQKVLKRKARLQVLTRRVGSLAQKIYKCGLHPAGMYGDEVSGISANSPLTAGRSLSALWLWYEDPTTSSVIAPTLRWSKEVWVAATHPRGEIGEHGQFWKVLNLPALRRVWERGRSQRPERWRSVKGPVGATFLRLDRIKWTWPSPFQFFDDNNTEIMLTTTSPALLKSMPSAAVRRTNQRQAAAKLADSSHFTGTRASLERARRVADSKGGRLSREDHRRFATQLSQSGQSAV